MLLGHLGSVDPGRHTGGDLVEGWVTGIDCVVVGHRGSLLPGTQVIGVGDVVTITGGGHLESLVPGLQDGGEVDGIVEVTGGHRGSLDPGKQLGGVVEEDSVTGIGRLVVVGQRGSSEPGKQTAGTPDSVVEEGDGHFGSLVPGWQGRGGLVSGCGGHLGSFGLITQFGMIKGGLVEGQRGSSEPRKQSGLEVVDAIGTEIGFGEVVSAMGTSVDV